MRKARAAGPARRSAPAAQKAYGVISPAVSGLKKRKLPLCKTTSSNLVIASCHKNNAEDEKEFASSVRSFLADYPKLRDRSG